MNCRPIQGQRRNSGPTSGYWKVGAGEQYYLADDNGELRTLNKIYYIHAETEDGTYSWSGTHRKRVDVDERELMFLEQRVSAVNPPYFGLRLQCRS